MKKSNKNLAMYILYFCMFVAVFCAMTLQSEAANVTTGTLGNSNGITWTYDADTKTLTITGEESNLHGKWDSTKGKFKSPFADICKDVEVIKVQNCTLKGSAKAMFANLESLKSVEFSNVNTSGVTDMIEMFSGCRKLSSVDVSKFDTSNVTNMKGMFYYCSSLSSLDVSKFNTSKVTDMSIMFYNCSGLSSLDVSKFDTSNVTDMSHMFYCCSKLSSLDVSKFNTSKVTNMKFMFYCCSKLSSLDVSKFDTSKVTSMHAMFDACSNLASLDLSNFDTSNVTDMSYMFYGCSKLSSLDVSNLYTSKVAHMTYMFYNCSKLSSLDVSHFNTSNVKNMSSMFSGCSSLATLDVSKFDTAKVTNMRYMFSGCSSLAALDISKFDTSKVTDMECMFADCGKLSSLDTSHFNTSKVTNMKSMFYNCKNLSSLDVSKFDTSNVTNMSGMFRCCSKLGSLDLSKFNTSKVTDMRYMFQLCSSLSSLDLSNFDTSKAADLYGMFSTCSSLSSLDMSGFDLTKVTDARYMFNSCNNLVCIETPKTIPETLSIDLPYTYGDLNGKQTKQITKNFSNTTLINKNYLVSEIKLNSSSLTVHMGKTGQLTATISPEKALNKTLTWKSSNTAVATVDANGKVTAVGAGTATITATAKDGTGVSASCEVTVIDKKKYLIRAFVERMYTVALGRAAEADGLDFYTERLLAGDSNGACLAQSFLCSPEFINKGYDDAQYVKVLYKTFFDREPAAEEVNYWVGQLNGGKTRAFVLAGFVNSVEFDNLCASYGISRGFMREDGKPINPGIGRFAERLYTVILERAGEKEGIEYWSLQMANGVCTPKDAAKSFFLSAEYLNKNTSDAKYITTLYRTFMDREPEAGGVEYWQNVLNNGATREQILEGFADSAEFKGIMANFGL